MRQLLVATILLSVMTLSACTSWTDTVPESTKAPDKTTSSGEVVHNVCPEWEIMADTVCVPYTGGGNNASLFGIDFTESIIEVDVSSGSLKWYYVEPKVPGNYPGIVMIHEWWGLNDNIKYMARLLANSGYKVFAIDLYDEVATTPERARELSGMVRNNPEEANNKMSQALAYLKENTATKLGTLGWCFGGQQSLNISLETPVDATVIYYGNLSEDVTKIANLQWPVLWVFGDKDTSIPLDKIQLFQKNLNDLGKENSFYIYPGLGHAFANPSGANYASGQTVDAWNKTLEFLDSTLN